MPRKKSTALKVVKKQNDAPELNGAGSGDQAASNQEGQTATGAAGEPERSGGEAKSPKDELSTSPGERDTPTLQECFMLVDMALRELVVLRDLIVEMCHYSGHNRLLLKRKIEQYKPQFPGPAKGLSK